MQVTITIPELEYAAQKYVGLSLKFAVVNDNTIAVSYQPKQSGIMSLLASWVSINLSIERIVGSDIYINCNEALKVFAPILSESKIPGLLTTEGNCLLVHLDKVDSLEKALDNIKLESISFANDSAIAFVSLR